MNKRRICITLKNSLNLVFDETVLPEGETLERVMMNFRERLSLWKRGVGDPVCGIGMTIILVLDEVASVTLISDFDK